MLNMGSVQAKESYVLMSNIGGVFKVKKAMF